MDPRDEPKSIGELLAGYGRALSTKDVAKVLAVSQRLVSQQATAGLLPSFRVGTAIRFCPRELARWLKCEPADTHYLKSLATWRTRSGRRTRSGQSRP